MNDDSVTIVTILFMSVLILIGLFALYKFFTLAPEWAIWSGIAGICFGFVSAIAKE